MIPIALQAVRVTRVLTVTVPLRELSANLTQVANVMSAMDVSMTTAASLIFRRLTMTAAPTAPARWTTAANPTKAASPTKTAVLTPPVVVTRTTTATRVARVTALPHVTMRPASRAATRLAQAIALDLSANARGAAPALPDALKHPAVVVATPCARRHRPHPHLAHALDLTATTPIRARLLPWCVTQPTQWLVRR